MKGSWLRNYVEKFENFTALHVKIWLGYFHDLKAEENTGMAMVFILVDAAVEWINNHVSEADPSPGHQEVSTRSLYNYRLLMRSTCDHEDCIRYWLTKVAGLLGHEAEIRNLLLIYLIIRNFFAQGLKIS